MISLRGLVDNIIYFNYRDHDFEMLLTQFQRHIQEDTLIWYLDLMVDLPCNEESFT